MRKIILILLSVIIILTANAAVRITGNVYNSEGQALGGIIVRLYPVGGASPVAFTRSDNKGNFAISTDSLALPARLVLVSPKYEEKTVYIEDPSKPLKVSLNKGAYKLDEVVVKAPHTRVKGDTISYDVSAFTGRGDRSIEDVIKKLPGVTVDKGGKIYYGEKPINNFYIEGLNLMGNNYQVASRNITPEDISTIDIYDRHQAKRVLKGVQEDDRAALNLRLKKGRMLKPLGHVTAGGGYGERMLWLGQLYGMLISPNNQTIISANGNNSGSPYASLSYDRNASKAYSMFTFMPFGTPPISQARFLNNKSAYFSANTLFKLKDETTLTVNSSYSLEHSKYSNLTRTEYFATGEENTVFEQNATSRMSQHGVFVSLKAEKNKDSFFFSDQAWFAGYFNDNSYSLRNPESVNQTLRNHDFRAGNSLKTIFRKGSKVYELNSYTSVNNTPVNSMTASGADGEEGLSQTVKGLSFINSESTTFSWLLNRKSTAGIGIFFEADYDRMHTYGAAGDQSMTENDISGFKLRTVATPFYKFAIPGKFTIRVQFPVNLYNINYTDIATSSKYIHNRPYVDFATSIMYKPHQQFVADFGLGRSYTIGDMSNFIINPVYTTYRTRSTLGNGALNIARRDYVKGDFNYRNLPEGLYLLAMASYSRTKHNSLSVYDVGQGGASTSTSSVNTSNHTESTHASLTATKDVREWRTMFSVNGSGLWSSRNSIRAGKEIRNRSSFYSAGGKIETTQFSDILNVYGEVSWSRTTQSFHGMMPDVSLDDLSFNGKISVFPLPILEIYGKADLRRSQFTDDSYKSNLFVDAGVRLKLRKFEIELTGTNLTNIRDYSYTIYNSLDLITYSYTLRPIQAMLTARYSF